MKRRSLAASVLLFLFAAFLVACQTAPDTKPAAGSHIRMVKFTIPSCG